MAVKTLASKLPPWPAKSIIDSQISNLEYNINKAFPNQNNMLIDATWILKEEINIENIDNIFYFAPFDPLPFELPSIKDHTHYIGNVDSRSYRISTHAIICARLFKNYSNNELELNFDNLKLFLCYQSKPHNHRQWLTKKIIDNNLLDKGVITLNMDLHRNYQINLGLPRLSVEESIDIKYLQDNGITPTNNPYSLGSLDTWNRCFLNVVSETASFLDFVSEKTFKPLIGMRPFILNGHPDILAYLKDQGFHTFEEYWPVKFSTANNSDDVVNRCVEILKIVNNLSIEDIKYLYNDMLPKLILNRERFFQFAHEQDIKLRDLFLC